MGKYISNLVKEFLKPKKILECVGDFKNKECLLANNETQQYIYEPSFFTIKGTGYIILDFGEELQGGIRILTTRYEGFYCGELRIRFGESVDECCSDIGEKNSTNHHSIRDFLVTMPNLSDQEFGKSGFRFVRIDFLSPNVTYNVVNIYACYVHTKQKVKGKLKTDDLLVNKIFNAATRTLYLNCQENLLEGIKRDRLVWIGDMQPEVLGITYLFGNSDIVYRAINDSIRKNPLPIWFGNIPVYSFWLIQIIYDYYLKNNNKEDILPCLPYIDGLFKQLDDCVDDKGIIDYSKGEAPARNGYFLDWPTNGTEDAKEGNRFVFIVTLNTYKKLCSSIGVKENPLADKLLKKLNACQQKEVTRKQVVALGYFAGRISKEEAKDKLLKNGVSDISIYLSYYIFKAIAEVAGNQVALMKMKEYYGAMISRGATTFWENFDIEMLEGSGRIDRKTPKNKLSIHGDFGANCYLGYRLSLCHGWSCTPIQFMYENILGFKVVEPGCKKVSIKPDLCDLNEIKATIPTSFGVLKVKAYKKNNQTIVEYNKQKGMEIVE